MSSAFVHFLYFVLRLFERVANFGFSYQATDGSPRRIDICLSWKLRDLVFLGGKFHKVCNQCGFSRQIVGRIE